jgi:asparagine synthase (glutamine-hydrolysing)
VLGTRAHDELEAGALMCGIAGLIDPEGLAAEWRDDLEALGTSLRHRGPDDHGFLTDLHGADSPDQFGAARRELTGTPRVAFVHRRLSILDLSEAARQPMARLGGKVFLTYNGEVYNYRELRDELAALGVRFQTRSDTEVVLEAYLRWGIDAVKRLRGIFAFAIVDLIRGKAYLVRDHLGVKPLYHGRFGTRWVFSSELKAFRRLSGFRAAIDPAAIRTYLHFLWIPGTHSGLDGVHKLEPGTWLEIDLATGNERRETYWDPIQQQLAVQPVSSIDAAVEHLGAELERVVSEQMVSDVPLGAFLSGGLDSSVLVALMQRSGARRVSTYSVGYSKADLAYDVVPDDLPFARDVSQHFGTDSHEIALEPDVASLLPQVVDALDEPIGDPAALSSYLISEAARRTLTVMLSGMGADELFGGYPRQRALLYGHAFRSLPGPIRRLAARAVQWLPGAGRGPIARVGRNGKKFLAAAERDPLSHYIAMETYFPPELQRELLTPDGELGRAPDPVAAEVVVRRRRIETAAPGDSLRQAMLWDLVTYLPSLNLAYTDRTSMAHGIEVRVPFLDVRLVEWSLGLRARELIRSRRGRMHGKYVLKRAAGRLLPERIVWRSKAGFGAPVRSWLRNDLAEMSTELLGPRGLGGRGWFEPAGIARLKQDFLSGRSDYSLQLWMLMSLELWLRQ